MKTSEIPELLHTKQRVDERMTQFFAEELASAKNDDEKKLLSEIAEYCLRGGKRLRAFLLHIGYRFSGGTAQENLLDIAVALELMHAAALMQDDYIDNDTKRRGKPTFHRAVPRTQQRTRALEASNILFGRSRTLLLRSNFPDELKCQAVAEFSTEALLTGFGEAMDLYHSFSLTPGKAVIEAILRLKTARYTLSGPLSLGSLLAYGTKQERLTLETIGEKIGIAFQLADDALGIFGSAAIGKDLASDLREGKPTLIFQEAWERMNQKERAQSLRLLQKNILKPSEIRKLRSLVLGKVDKHEIEELTASFIRDALKKIDSLSLNEDVRRDLCAVASFATERTL